VQGSGTCLAYPAGSQIGESSEVRDRESIEMKDETRKNRNWDNDNFIMKKYGSSIRANIADTLLRAHRSVMIHRTLAQAQNAALESIPLEKCANA
jgi:hypothetical protein